MANQIQCRGGFKQRFPNPKKKVIIIGGGVGGLTLAAKLDNSKFNVTIYEKNDKCGGRCSTIHKKGFTFEKGAILYLFDDVYKHVFKQLDSSDVLKNIGFVKDDKYHQIFLGDKTVFKYSTNTDDIAEQVNKLEKRTDADKKLRSFCDECKSIEKFVFENVFYKTYDTRWDVLRMVFNVLRNNFWTNLKILIKAYWYSMYKIVQQYFESDAVCQAFSFQSLYFGISPFTGSSLFSILVASEIASGLKYPQKGMSSIVEALEAIAIQRGVEIKKGKGVKRIIVDGNNKATGVKLDGNDDKTVTCDVVVSNADLTYTYNELLKYVPVGEPSQHSGTVNNVRTVEQRALEQFAGELTKKDHAPSTITFFWGLKRRLGKLKAHNIFLPPDYKKLFDDIHVHRKIPDDPAFFIHIANRMDEHMAPEKCDALTVIVPIGEMADEQGVKGGFDEKVEMVRKKVIARLEETLGESDFASLIDTEIEPQTPEKWKTDFNCWQGNILGFSHSLNNLLHNRPNQKCAQLKNVYFVGASTQPGAGVPLVMCSALSLAPKIEKEHAEPNHMACDTKKMK